MAVDQSNYSMSAGNQDSLCVHWGAIFSGMFIAVLTHLTLMSLGFALGATGVKSVIEGGTSAQALGAGAGGWMILSVLISLFVGSYAASRVSGVIATRIGYTQGAVVTALFFSVMVSQIGLSLGALGLGLGAATSKVFGAVGDLGSSPAVTRIVEDSLSDLKLDQRAQMVTSGVLSRVVSGDQDSAITYLANEAGMSRAEAERRLQAVQTKVQDTLTTMATKSADAAKVLGWTAFGVMLLGAISSMFGGAVGAQINFRRPIGKLDRKAMPAKQSPAFT